MTCNTLFYNIIVSFWWNGQIQGWFTFNVFLVSKIICLIITRKCVDTLFSGCNEKQVLSMSCELAFLLSAIPLWSYTLPWPELTETTFKHKKNLLPEWFLSLIENKECFLCCQQPVEQWDLNQHKNKQTNNILPYRRMSCKHF